MRIGSSVNRKGFERLKKKNKNCVRSFARGAWLINVDIMLFNKVIEKTPDCGNGTRISLRRLIMLRSDCENDTSNLNGVSESLTTERLSFTDNSTVIRECRPARLGTRTRGSMTPRRDRKYRDPHVPPAYATSANAVQSVNASIPRELFSHSFFGFVFS